MTREQDRRNALAEKVQHSALSNNFNRSVLICLFAGQVMIGQFLPLLRMRDALFLPRKFVEFPFGQTWALVFCSSVIVFLLLSLFIKPLQFYAAVLYASLKAYLVYSLIGVDGWAAAYFSVHALAGIVLAATSWRWHGSNGNIGTN